MWLGSGFLGDHAAGMEARLSQIGERLVTPLVQEDRVQPLRFAEHLVSAIAYRAVPIGLPHICDPAAYQFVLPIMHRPIAPATTDRRREWN